VYRQAGQETEGRQIAIARRSDLRRYGSLTRPPELGNWLLDKTIKHGYQPLRAVGLLVAVYLAVMLVAWGAQHHDSVIVPAKDTKSITPAPTALHCSPGYPCSIRLGMPWTSWCRLSTCGRRRVGVWMATPPGVGPILRSGGSPPGLAGPSRPWRSPATPA
jgi:hypothetical protein